MAATLKPSNKYQHLFAILRYETDTDEKVPIDLRVTVKKVVVDAHYAQSEVKRLNELNKDKGSYYFCQVTRFEDAPVEVEMLPAMQLTAGSESQD
jgi:hypothetical protein